MRTSRVRLRGVPVPEAEWELARQNPQGEAAIGEDFILCLVCGRRFSRLDGKHFGIHGMTSDEYREAWGYPAPQPLSSRAVVELHRIRSSARPAEAYRRGADTTNFRSEITAERICKILVRTGSVRETCLELNCAGSMIQDRLKAAGTSSAEVLRNVEPPPPPSLSPQMEMKLRRLLRAVAARFARPGRFEGALRVLLADQSSCRRTQILAGQWQRKLGPHGYVKLAGTWASGLPGGSEVDLILRDGCLDIRGKDGQGRTFKVGSQGLGFGNVPAQNQAGATVGVGRVPLGEAGNAKALHGEDVSFGRDYRGQSVFRFFHGSEALFLDSDGCPLETGTRWQRIERKRLMRARSAVAGFDADAQAASAIFWLLGRWRQDDRAFTGRFGRTILVAGVLPGEPLTYGNWRFSTFREDGRCSKSRFLCSVQGRVTISFFGPWLCLRDVDGTLLGWRNWGGLGFDVRRLHHIRTETLHVVTVRSVRPGSLHRIEVSLGSFIWRLTVPSSHREVKPDRAAVVATKLPHCEPTFTLHLLKDGREQSVPLTWRARRLAPGLRDRLDAMPEGVRYIVDRPLLRRLVRTLQPGLLDRALAGLSTLPAVRDDLARLGPLGTAVAKALMAACQALLHVLVHVLRICSPDPDSADHAVRALCLLADFEGLVAMAGMARDVLVGTHADRECEVGTDGRVRDRTGGFLRGWIEVGARSLPEDGMVLVQLDYREIAFATMGLHGTLIRPYQIPPAGHDLAEMSWSDAVHTLRNDAALARRLEDSRDRAGGNAERRLAIGRTHDSVVIGVECLLYDLEQRAVVRWLHRNGLASSVEADSSGLRFDVGPCFDDLAQLRVRAAQPPSGP